MRRFAGIIFLLALSAFASCSDGGDDSVVRACRVIVDSCKKGDSVGMCIDDLGPLAADCLGCISGHGCSYATCQSDIPGCRLPGYMLDPKDRIDPGPRPLDAGATDTGQAETGPIEDGIERMSDDFASLDATAQAELVRHGKASPLELTEAAIRRIERINPAINAVVTEQFERALRDARGPLPDGPFRGVPFLIKDLHAADPGVRMTQGSRFLEHYVPDYESELLSRFKRAGLVIVGRTNTPEFGIPPTTEPALFGACKNPWNPARSSGGSSGGAAAAVAAQLVPMAHASDGGGSIRIPASCCGIFGIKPTRARTPAGPKIGESTGGIAVQFAVSISVRDSARLLDATAGPALGDPYNAPPQARPYADEVTTRPGRLRIAVMREAWNRATIDPECSRAMDSTAVLLRELGHEVVDRPLELRDTADFFSNFVTIWSVAAASTLNAAEESVGRAATPEDVEPLTWMLSSIGRGRSAVDYLSAMRSLHVTAREVAAFFTDFDVLVTPTLARPPVMLGELDCPPSEPLRGFVKAGDYAAFTALFNVTGQPAMSVPLYHSADGLPIGTQCVGRFGDEGTLFRLAGELERARPWATRIPPIAASRTAPESS